MIDIKATKGQPRGTHESRSEFAFHLTNTVVIVAESVKHLLISKIKIGRIRLN